MGEGRSCYQHMTIPYTVYYKNYFYNNHTPNFISAIGTLSVSHSSPFQGGSRLDEVPPANIITNRNFTHILCLFEDFLFINCFGFLCKINSQKWLILQCRLPKNTKRQTPHHTFWIPTPALSRGLISKTWQPCDPDNQSEFVEARNTLSRRYCE